MNEEVTLDEFTGADESKTSQQDWLAPTDSFPQDWQVVDFESVLEDIRYGTDTKSNTEGRGFPTLRIPNIVDKKVTTDDLKYTELDGEEANRLMLDNGDILLIRTNGNPNYVGRCAVFDGELDDCVYASYLIRLRLDEHSSLPKFVSEFLNSHLGRIEMSGWINTSAGNHNIGISAIENFSLPLPPISEQRQIIAVLHNVNEAIEKTEEIIDQATRVRKGLMQDLFRYGLDENGELRDSGDGSEPYRKTKYGEIPESWDIVPLSQLVPEDAPIVYGILKPGDHQPDGVPVVKVKDIHDGEVKQGDILHTSQEIHEDFKRAELREGDLLFTIRGTVGRMAFVPERLDGGNITQDTARIRVTEANPRFVRYFFETETPNNYFERNTIGQAVQGINLEDLREVPVHLPSEEEQARIVEIIDQHSEALRNERDYLQHLQRFKRGLMQDLLSGAVRTTDTNIEVPEEIAQHG